MQKGITRSKKTVITQLLCSTKHCSLSQLTVLVSGPKMILFGPVVAVSQLLSTLFPAAVSSSDKYSLQLAHDCSGTCRS